MLGLNSSNLHFQKEQKKAILMHGWYFHFENQPMRDLETIQ